MPKRKRKSLPREHWLKPYVHLTEAQIVKRAVRALKKRLRLCHGAGGWNRGRTGLYAMCDMLNERGSSSIFAWGPQGHLERRIVKKAGQPYRKNKARKRMRRRAAGKAEVTRGAR